LNRLPHLRIFLGSPSDVEDERAIARKVIQELPFDPFLRGRVALEIVGWEERGSGPLLARISPQEAISQNLPLPSDCDIVIVIFRARMGSPLPIGRFKKPDGTPYLSGTEWEYENALSSAKPIIIVYRRKEEPIIKMSDPQRDEKIQQWEKVQAFFRNFKNERGYNLYASPEELREKLEDDLKVVIRDLLKKSTSTVSVTPTNEGFGERSPFPGLRALGPDDAFIFHGRGRETDGLLAKLDNSQCRFIAVVGASGSGKSSLVGAGLLPRLKANAIMGSKNWLVAIFRPGARQTRDPLEALAATLIGYLNKENISAHTIDSLRSQLSSKSETISGLIDNLLVNQPSWAEILLVIDQFEELFTLANPTHREEFVKVLAHITSCPRVRTIVTLRSDFYGACIESPVLADLLKDGSYPLAPPGLSALFEMITRPAQLAGLEFESDLSETILVHTGDNPGALPLMAYALDELYNARRDKDSKLTWDAYKSIGGVQGAIGTRAESVFGELDTLEQAAFHDVFRHLVQVDERGVVTRQQAKLKKVVVNAAADKLVSSLTEARLLVRTVDESNDPIVEVSHEALFLNWPRLASWINSLRDDLRLLYQIRVAAHEWVERGRSDAYYWPNERLQLVDQLINRLNPELTPLEQEFIRPEQERLYAELSYIATSHERRLAIGERLHVIGDTRFGVGVRNHHLPEIKWLIVEPGSVEIDSQIQAVNRFYIAKYPVTFSQFQQFVEDEEGYKQTHWWGGLAHQYEIPEPSRYKIGNYPRETVNWYEAIAFCRWLTWKTKQEEPSMEAIGEDWEIRLPTEFEWQLAATSGHPENIYPWGPEWNSAHANTFEAGIGRAVSVGMYPLGKAVGAGALDMSGGVWEWCLNRFKLGNQSNDIGGEATRVFRGGSFTRDATLARTTARQHSDPLSRRYDLGFRVILSMQRFIT
jgi:formylglycine-generating enzyme required for sulfatase activity